MLREHSRVLLGIVTLVGCSQPHAREGSATGSAVAVAHDDAAPAATPDAPAFGPPLETVSVKLLDVPITFAVPKGSTFDRMGSGTENGRYHYSDADVTIAILFLAGTGFDSPGARKRRSHPFSTNGDAKIIAERELPDGWVLSMRGQYDAIVERLLVVGTWGITCTVTIQRRDLTTPDDNWLAFAGTLCLGVRSP